MRGRNTPVSSSRAVAVPLEQHRHAPTTRLRSPTPTPTPGPSNIVHSSDVPVDVILTSKGSTIAEENDSVGVQHHHDEPTPTTGPAYALRPSKRRKGNKGDREGDGNQGSVSSLSTESTLSESPFE